MSRYEDPEGTGEYPAGGKRRGGSPFRRGRAGDTGDGGASGGSRRGRGPTDPWEPPGRSDRRAARASQPPSRTHRILGRHPVLSVLAILATPTVTFVTLSAYAAYRSVYDAIHHITVTNRELGPRPPKLDEVEFSQPSADKLFRAIARDNHILRTARRADHAKAAPVPTVKPSTVQLQVLNGTSIPGLAATTAGKLTARGFKVSGKGNAPSAAKATYIEYSSASQLPQVNTQEKEIPGAQPKQVTGLKGGTLGLVIGPGFKGVGAHKAKKPKSSATTAATLSKNYGGVNGSANICKQSSAFIGPDTPADFGN